ncbi:MAG: hypothetical protein ACRDZ8_10515 [Acidimicrobiales bacterium]
MTIVVVAAGLLPAVLFWRCRQVDDRRRRMLRTSYEQAVSDMNVGLPWEWRFEAARTGPTFNEMVWKVWRPVSSFDEP